MECLQYFFHPESGFNIGVDMSFLPDFIGSVSRHFLPGLLF
jgi:hypothetical protein